MGSPRELVKLYYRIGEVADILGVQPHVIRYWETEFRSIRPQKSSRGQRVYSRKDVEKLLRVKDLLRNQGFTIAGAKKKLREPDSSAAAEPRDMPEVREAPEPPASNDRMRQVLREVRDDIVRIIAELDRARR